MSKQGFISIGKFESGCINEDAALARAGMIAVSDGAGGGGVFAERWSQYLLDHLPDTPIRQAEELDNWINEIWEPFYNQCEADAQQLGGLLLDKFYDEGSFATLAAVWKTVDGECFWISFGDSVAFHYNQRSKLLEHSFGKIGDFDQPPYLINCKDELNPTGFRCGTFKTDSNSIVFAASDALAHYVLMMYEVAHRNRFAEELNEAEAHHSKNENYIKQAKAFPPRSFERDVLQKLQHSTGHKANFVRHLQGLIHKGVLAHDDYSFAYFQP